MKYFRSSDSLSRTWHVRSVGFAAILLAAMAGAQEKTNWEARKGSEVFQMYCVPCHGVNGEGDGPLARKLAAPPHSFRDVERMAVRTDADLERYIVGGGGPVHEQPMMPPWVSVLRQEDVANVVGYIRQLQGRK